MARYKNVVFVLFFMQRKYYYWIAGVFAIAGAVALINSFTGLTGFVVLEDGEYNLVTLVGLWFIIVGLLVYARGFLEGRERVKRWF